MIFLQWSDDQRNARVVVPHLLAPAPALPEGSSRHLAFLTFRAVAFVVQPLRIQALSAS